MNSEVTVNATGDVRNAPGHIKSTISFPSFLTTLRPSKIPMVSPLISFQTGTCEANAQKEHMLNSTEKINIEDLFFIMNSESQNAQQEISRPCLKSAFPLPHRPLRF